MTIKARALIPSVSLVIAYTRRDVPVKATNDNLPTPMRASSCSWWLTMEKESQLRVSARSYIQYSRENTR
jgi:hypothetical protein